MKNNKGFSLVELIVVIAIMAILAAVAIPTFATFINKANVAADEDFVSGVKYAIDLALTTDGDKAEEVAIEWDATAKAISKLSYTVGTGDDAKTYVVIGTAATGEEAAADQIKTDITSIIDLEYDLKANVTEIDVEGVEVTLKAAN